MTFLEQVADLLTGGALSSARFRADTSIMLYRSAEADVAELEGKADRFEAALRDIIAMETPRANGTVRRMAARAWKEMK